MDITPELRKQLMELTGMKDDKDFTDLVKDILPAIQKANNSSPKGPVGLKQSPIQPEFVNMISLLESNGVEKFEALKGDPKAQFAYTYKVLNACPEYQDMRNLVSPFPQESEKVLAEKSKTLRDRGNKHYQRKELDSALKEFCRAILMGPLDKDGRGREVSIGIANRSAVFFELEKIQECLDDIEASLMFGYPEELRFKLYERQARCRQTLGNHPGAKESIEKALDYLSKAHLKPNKMEEWKQELENFKVPADNEKAAEPKKTFNPEGPLKIWENLPNFPHISDAVDIVFNDDSGRFVIARDNIRAGEAIVIEDPISFHLSPYHMSKNCLHCVKSLHHSVLPSPLKRKARFCSLKCLKDALAMYHRLEMQMDIDSLFYSENEETQISGCIALAYRAVVQKNVDFFKKYQPHFFQTQDPKYGINMPNDFLFDGDEYYRGLFNLITHNKKATPKDQMTLMVKSFILLKCLQQSGYFTSDTSKQIQKELKEDELLIGFLLYHFQAGIQYNLHAIYQVQQKLEATKNIPLTDIGSGVYPTTLFFNHSCSPNTVRIYQGTKVTIVAKRNIYKGETVNDCYGIHHLSLTRKERQEELSRGFAFQCSCEACKSDFPLMKDLPMKLSPNVTVKLGTSMTKYKSLFESGKVIQALKMCQDYLAKLEDLKIPFPHRNHEMGSMALCTCLWALAMNS